ncbi:MAG: radical SAM protein [Candidatus Bathyarchaeota archaeon]|nr:radical SAM protein [Candidatus Bathyarchaeota archaeon]
MPSDMPICQETICHSVLGKLGVLNTQFWTSYCFDPYVNCGFNCVYCHTAAQKYDGSKEFLAPIYARTNAPKVLKRELSKFKRKGTLRLSLNTDPYQPAEKKFKITRQLLEVLKDNEWPFAIGTKSDLVLRDLDLIVQASQKAWSCIGITITTLDEKLAKLLEPDAPSPKRRLEAVRRLSNEGITVGVWLIPLMPYVNDTDQNMANVIKAATENGAKFVLTGMLDMRGSYRFKRFLAEHYKQIAPRYEFLYKGKPTAPSCGNMEESYLYDRYSKFISLCQKYKVPNYIPHFYSRKQALLFYIHNFSHFEGTPIFELTQPLNFLFPSKEILQAVQIRYGKRKLGKSALKVLGAFPK